MSCTVAMTMPIASIAGFLLGWLLAGLSLFLILLILVQRGKGGGLAGALGGPGGQSAFGSKAGDTFTVVTVAVALMWGFTCALTMLVFKTDSASIAEVDPTAAVISDDPGQDEPIGTLSNDPQDLPNGSIDLSDLDLNLDGGDVADADADVDVDMEADAGGDASSSDASETNP